MTCKPCNFEGLMPNVFDCKSEISISQTIEILHTSAENLFDKLFADKRCPDLTIIDPPYELNTFGGGKTSLKSLKKIEFGLDDIKNGFDYENIFGKIQSLCKQHKKLLQIYCFCSNKQISKLMAWGEKNGYITTCLVWHKYNSVPTVNGNWRPDLEYIIHIREAGAHFVGGIKLKSKFISLPYEKSKHGHPTEKPEKLIKNLVLVSSSEEDLVLDCFSGSGTTAEVCKQLNRSFIGSEINEKYHRSSISRINQQKCKQYKLAFTN